MVAHLLWVQEVGGSNPPSPTSSRGTCRRERCRTASGALQVERSCWPPSMSYVAPVSAVLIMMCTASAATSSGPTTRPMGSVDLSSSRRLSRSSPSSRADNGVSTKPGAMRLMPNGGEVEREVRDERGECSRDRSDEGEAGARTAPTSATDEQQRAAGPHPPDRLRATLSVWVSLSDNATRASSGFISSGGCSAVRPR